MRSHCKYGHIHDLHFTNTKIKQTQISHDKYNKTKYLYWYIRDKDLEKHVVKLQMFFFYAAYLEDFKKSFSLNPPDTAH